MRRDEPPGGRCGARRSWQRAGCRSARPHRGVVARRTRDRAGGGRSARHPRPVSRLSRWWSRRSAAASTGLQRARRQGERPAGGDDAPPRRRWVSRSRPAPAWFAGARRARPPIAAAAAAARPGGGSQGGDGARGGGVRRSRGSAFSTPAASQSRGPEFWAAWQRIWPRRGRESRARRGARRLARLLAWDASFLPVVAERRRRARAGRVRCDAPGVGAGARCAGGRAGSARRSRCRWWRRRRSCSSAGGTRRAALLRGGAGRARRGRGRGSASRGCRAGGWTTPGSRRRLRLALGDRGQRCSCRPCSRCCARSCRNAGDDLDGAAATRPAWEAAAGLGRRCCSARGAAPPGAAPPGGTGAGAVGAPVRGPHRRRVLGRGGGAPPPAGRRRSGWPRRPRRDGRRRRVRGDRRGARAGARGRLAGATAWCSRP